MSRGWKEYSGGPAINLQSLGSGQFMSIPREAGLSASYGYYYQGSRIGEFTEKLVGTETYQGIQCYKVEGNLNMDVTIGGIKLSANGDTIGYFDTSDSMPKYMSFTFNYTSPAQTTATMDFAWNRAQSKMATTVSLLGQTASVVASLPSDYWEPIPSLYVGYSKQFTYTIDSTSVTMTISVTGKEDVTVPKGTYKDCYVVKITQPQVGIDMTMWIDKEGILPKADVSMALSGAGTTTFTVKLEHYGIAP